MTVFRTRSSIMIMMLAVTLPGCARPVSAPTSKDSPAQAVPDEPPAQDSAEDGEQSRKPDLDVDVEDNGVAVDVGENGVNVDVGKNGVNVDVGSQGVPVDIGDDADQDTPP
jgi:hypothetical protein